MKTNLIGLEAEFKPEARPCNFYTERRPLYLAKKTDRRYTAINGVEG